MNFDVDRYGGILLEAVRSVLSEREGWIIAQRYGLLDFRVPQTFSQIGAAHGISLERARQICLRAEKKLAMRIRLTALNLDRRGEMKKRPKKIEPVRRPTTKDVRRRG